MNLFLNKAFNDLKNLPLNKETKAVLVSAMTAAVEGKSKVTVLAKNVLIAPLTYLGFNTKYISEKELEIKW